LALVLAGALEGALEDGLDAGSRRGVALARIEVGAFGVLAERELDPLWRAREAQLVRMAPPAELEHLAAPTDRVGRAVQALDRRHASGERAVDREIVRLDHVADVALGRDRER